MIYSRQAQAELLTSGTRNTDEMDNGLIVIKIANDIQSWTISKATATSVSTNVPLHDPSWGGLLRL